MNVSRYRNKSSLFRDPVASIFADPEEVRGQTKHGTRVHCKPVPLGPPVPALSRLHHVKGDLFSSPADEPLARLHHVKGDLFSSPADEPLAHCISEDCRMGAGIAVLFRKTFGGVAELKAQKKTPGQCAVLKRGRRWIYYLVTKKKASQKPTYDALRLSLEAMKVHCLENGVLSLSMPRIGCGLDRLKWEKVASMIEEVFRSTSVYVSVYTLPLSRSMT